MTQEIKKVKNAPITVRGELGTEDIDTTDIQLPRLKIAQATSSIVKESDIKVGEIYNATTGESYGNSLEFFPLYIWKSQVWFADMKLIATIHYVGKEPVKIGDVEYADNHPDEGILSYNYFIIPVKEIKDATLPMVFSCSSAAVKYARQLNTKLKLNSLKNIPIYGQVVNLKSQSVSFAKGSAYMPKFSYGRFATKSEINTLKDMFAFCKSIMVTKENVEKVFKEEPKDDDEIPF